MFGFMPDPVEDELLYGVLARYASMWGLEASSWFAKRTLGPNTSADMPRVGMFLAQPMPASWRRSADEIIDDMTTAKYYEHGRTAVSAARYRCVMAEHVPLDERQKTGVKIAQPPEIANAALVRRLRPGGSAEREAGDVAPGAPTAPGPLLPEAREPPAGFTRQHLDAIGARGLPPRSDGIRRATLPLPPGRGTPPG